MGIRDDLARTHGVFVGLRELLKALERSEGVSFQEAAAWLSRRLLEAQARNEGAPEWRRYSPATGVLRAVGPPAKKARELLEVCANSGESMLTALDEYGEADALGFHINEVTEYLQRHGMTLDLQSGGAAPALARAAQDWPDWRKALAARPLLSVYEAASALAGVDPRAPGYPSDEEQAEVSRWETTLEDCIEAGQLPHLERNDGNGGTVLRIRPADLAAWCARVPGGLAYPLPGPQALPATDPGLREALAAAEAARVDLAAQVLRLEGERDKAQRAQEDQRQRADGLAGELKALKDAHSIELLKERQQRQQAEEVAGDLAGDFLSVKQERDSQRQRADNVAGELAALKQGQQQAEAKAAQEWAELLAELENIKARHVSEQERLRAASAEYEALTDALKRARAEMEQRQREEDADFSRLRADHDRLKGDHERLQRQKWEQEGDQARTLQELDRVHEELAKLQQAQAGSVSAEGQERQPGRLDARKADTYLRTIGGLLKLLLREGTTRTHYGSQAAVIAALLERHPGLRGLSKSTLEAAFAEARRTLPEGAPQDGAPQ